MTDHPTPEDDDTTSARDNTNRGRTGLAERVDSALVRSSGLAQMVEADEREREVIIRAMAIGFRLSRFLGMTVAILLFASGLWFAGLLILFAGDVPLWAARFHARRRGVDFFRQSGYARRESSVSSLLIWLGLMVVIVGLIAFHSLTGHPLITWSWRLDFSSDFGFAAAPIIGGVIGGVLGWSMRRRRLRRDDL